MAIMLHGRIRHIKNFNSDQVAILFPVDFRFRIGLIATKPLVLHEEKPKPATMREKVAAIKKTLKKNQDALTGMDESKERARLMEDSLDARDHYAREMNTSLGPLAKYEIAEKMQSMVCGTLTDRVVISLQKMSKALRQIMMEDEYDEQRVRCAGQVQTLCALVKDFHFSYHYLDRKNYQDAIRIYRKLVPDEKKKNGDPKENIGNVAVLVKKDGKYAKLGEEFVNACYGMASNAQPGTPAPADKKKKPPF